MREDGKCLCTRSLDWYTRIQVEKKKCLSKGQVRVGAESGREESYLRNAEP